MSFGDEMISWADVESRAMRPKVERQLREHSKVEQCGLRSPKLIAWVLGAVAGRAEPRGRKKGSRKEFPSPEGQIDHPKPNISR